MNSHDDQQLRLEAMKIATGRLNASASIELLTKEAAIVYAFLTASTAKPVTDVTDTKPTVTDSGAASFFPSRPSEGQDDGMGMGYRFLKGAWRKPDAVIELSGVTDSQEAHNQKAVDEMKTFYGSHLDADTPSALASGPTTRNLADMLPTLKPTTTYDFNKPTDDSKGYQ
jgi:hypothetical protein